jgi:hypothetical protein
VDSEAWPRQASFDARSASTIISKGPLPQEPCAPVAVEWTPLVVTAEPDAGIVARNDRIGIEPEG